MNPRRRRHERSSSLTSLLDVLFILLFASLIQAQSAAESGVLQPMASDMAEGARDAGSNDALSPGDAGVDAGTDEPSDASTGGTVALASDPGETPHLLRSRALATAFARSVRNQDVYTVEILADGRILAMSEQRRDGSERRDLVDYRLLSDSFPPVYIDHGTSRLCHLVAAQFDIPADQTNKGIVSVILAIPFKDAPMALTGGLNKDLAHCIEKIGVKGIQLDPREDRGGLR